MRACAGLSEETGSMYIGGGVLALAIIIILLIILL